MTYDLEERTIAFAKGILSMVRKLPQNAVTRPLISQIVRSGTSIGANYREADAAGSKKEFAHRISLCKREAHETSYWLEMLMEIVPGDKEDFEPLMKEARELVSIFAKIHRSTRSALKEDDIRH